GCQIGTWRASLSSGGRGREWAASCRLRWPTTWGCRCRSIMGEQPVSRLSCPPEALLMLIVPLALRPELARTLGEWHFAEWADLYPDWTLKACQDELASHAVLDRLPTTLVAVGDDGAPLGSVSLLLDDLPGYEHFSPWLASLYVRPDCRGGGLGGKLLAAALA